MFLPFLSLGSVQLKIGTSGYVTIDGNNYPRGQVYSYYGYGRDTSLQITGVGLSIGGYTKQYFLDGDNSDAPFTSMTALKAWMDANFEQASPLTDISVGVSIVNSTPLSVMCIDEDGNLQTYASFTYNDGDGKSYINGNRVTTNDLLGAVCFTNDIVSLLNVPPVALSGEYSDLTGKPTISLVGQTGNYDDLIGLPSIPSFQAFTCNGTGSTTFTFTVPGGYSHLFFVFSNTPLTSKGIDGCSLSGTTVTCTTRIANTVGVNNITGWYSAN